MIWNDPAPYMDKDYIKALECDQNTFQTPSLEVLLAAVAYSGMFYLAYDWIDVFRPRVKRNNRDSAHPGNNDVVFEDQDEDYFLHDRSSYQTTKANDVSFWVWLSLVIFLVFMIAYASMYIGVNTFDQVFYAMSLGYGFFCVYYYFFKDSMCQKTVLTSEKMIHSSNIITNLVVHIVPLILMIVVNRVVYYFQVKDFTVNPKWKSEHFDECGVLPFPSFFDKEMWFTYNWMYFNIGCAVGVAFDALVLGGTRVDYNQVRKSDGRNAWLALILRFIIAGAWILLNLWGFVALLEMMIHHWLFVMAIPYFVCGFGLFSFIKYLFLFSGASRAEIFPIPEMNAVELRRAD
jgi:membrane-associated phospholipid phosphatase